MPDQVFDWESIRRRLAATASAIAELPGSDPQAERRILEARARALAKPPPRPDDVERLEVLAFTLAGETYGIETTHVREVCRLGELVPLPCTPPFVAGIMNLRGQILAVFDLRRLFDLPARGLGELDQVIVLGDRDQRLGLLADAIAGVQSIALSALQPGLPTLTGIREKFCRGVTGQMLALLDGAKLLADASLKVNDPVTR